MTFSPSCALFLLLLLVIIPALVAQSSFEHDGVWIPRQQNTTMDGKPLSAYRQRYAFEKIYLPVWSLMLNPSREKYLVLKPLIQTEYLNFCRMGRNILNNVFSNATCSNLFCKANSSLVLFASSKNISQTTKENYISALHNFCYYCDRDYIMRVNGSVTYYDEFTIFHELLNAVDEYDRPLCPHFTFDFQTAEGKQCGGPNSGYPISYYFIFNNDDPFLCYCKKGNMYGFQCDHFTYFFIPLRYDIAPWIFMSLNMLMIWFVVTMVLIPNAYSKIKLWTYYRKLRKIGFWEALPSLILSLFCLKSLCTYMFLVSLMVMFPEHFLSTTFKFLFQNGQSIFESKENLSYASMCCLCFAISFILVLWFKIVYGKIPVLGYILLGIAYGCQIALNITVPILRHYVVGNTALEVVCAVILPFYFGIYILGFLAFGTKLYCSIRQIRKYVRTDLTWRKLKFTHFAVVAIIFMTLLIIVTAFFNITTFIAWDVFGALFYLLNSLFISSVYYLLSGVLCYLLFSTSSFLEMYGICCRCLRTKTVDPTLDNIPTSSSLRLPNSSIEEEDDALTVPTNPAYAEVQAPKTLKVSLLDESDSENEEQEAPNVPEQNSVNLVSAVQDITGRTPTAKYYVNDDYQ